MTWNWCYLHYKANLKYSGFLFPTASPFSSSPQNSLIFFIFFVRFFSRKYVNFCVCFYQKLTFLEHSEKTSTYRFELENNHILGRLKTSFSDPRFKLVESKIFESHPYIVHSVCLFYARCGYTISCVILFLFIFCLFRHLYC